MLSFFASEMGCDYYTYVITRIQFTNENGTLISYDEQGERERHEYYGGGPGYDPDLEPPVSYSDCIQAVIDMHAWGYGEKNLFVNGQWTCQPAGKERLLALCAAQEIPVATVVRIYKFKSGHML